MADLLNQDEIDALLNSSLSEDSSDDEPTQVAETEKPSGRTKRFYHQENKNQRFHFAYHSPVIKRSRLVLNPDPENASPKGKVVVRSMENYAQHMRRQRASAR